MVPVTCSLVTFVACEGSYVCKASSDAVGRRLAWFLKKDGVDWAKNCNDNKHGLFSIDCAGGELAGGQGCISSRKTEVSLFRDTQLQEKRHSCRPSEAGCERVTDHCNHCDTLCVGICTEADSDDVTVDL